MYEQTVSLMYGVSGMRLPCTRTSISYNHLVITTARSDSDAFFANAEVRRVFSPLSFVSSYIVIPRLINILLL